MGSASPPLSLITRQVSLQDIHGVDLRFAWLDVKAPVRLDALSPAVLLVGAAIEFDSRSLAIVPGMSLDDSCRALAGLLAKHSLNLVSDGCPGIPNRVEEAYLSEPQRGLAFDLSVLRTPDETGTQRAYSPTGFPTCGDLVLYCGAGFEILSIINTHCVDLVLVIGGGLGSLMEGIVAVVNDLPVVCFSPAGGVSVEMQPLFHRYRSRYKNLRITDCESLDSLDACFGAFAAGFRARAEPSRLHRFLQGFESLDPSPDTTISVDEELRWITYRCGDAEVRLERPVLVIDDARLMEHAEAGAAIRSRLETAPRRYQYGAVSIHVPAALSSIIWCPSIDSFVLLAALRSHAPREYDRALDIGAGTGLISLWIAIAGQARQVTAIDANAEAARCAAVNAAILGMSHRCTIRAEGFRDLARGGETFDLIVCNPPYVPRLDSANREDGCFEGVGLIIDLLSTLPQVLAANGVCFLTLSSTSWTDATVNRLMRDLVAARRAVLVREESLPFKVADVIVQKSWLGQLTERGGVFHHPERSYAWWHVTQVWRITLAPDEISASSPVASCYTALEERGNG